VSSTAVNSPEGVGRDIKYVFTDINQLRIDQAPRRLPAWRPRHLQTAGDRVSFSSQRQPDGHALLTIAVPQPATLGVMPRPITPSAISSR
jgi:hypothetical protein